jgi:hypothetical protein
MTRAHALEVSPEPELEEERQAASQPPLSPWWRHRYDAATGTMRGLFATLESARLGTLRAYLSGSLAAARG